MAIVNRTNPFDLLIENQYRGQATPVLYIVSAEREDDDSQHIRFHFQNKGDKDYELKALTKADADNFHFALVFRPSTLLYSAPEEIRTKFQSAIGDDWAVSAPAEQADATIIIYFSSQKDCSIKMGGRLSFLVKGLSGAAATGSRSTQVQLLFREPVGDSFIVRTRNQHLDVVNHDGKTFAQLDFVILGTPTIVHRSLENIIRVQVVETNGRNIAVTENTWIDFKFPFYTGNYDPDYHPAWVFGEQSKVNVIVCQKDEKEATAIKTDAVGNDVSLGNWGYKNIRVGFGKIESINNLILKFLHIPADGPIGDARIKITVSNLPGYWDTEFELKVEKSLMSTQYYDNPDKKISRDYGMLSNQVLIGDHLTDGWQKDEALHSSLSITSAVVVDKYDKSGEEKSKITELLRLHDERKGMNGMVISVGNEANASDGNLIRADQYNYGPRFKVDFGGNLWADGRIKDQTGFVMPVGAIIAYGGNKRDKRGNIIPPDGWKICNGDWLNYEDSNWKSVHKDLYEALGMPTLKDITWGDGSGVKKAFQLPDLRSRFIIGVNPDNEKYHLNKTGGEEEHKLTNIEIPKHQHSGTTNMDGEHAHTGQRTSRADNDDNDCAGDFINDGNRDYYLNWVGYVSSNGSSHSHHFTTDEDGGGDQPHNNLPPYYALTYIIKY